MRSWSISLLCMALAACTSKTPTEPTAESKPGINEAELSPEKAFETYATEARLLAESGLASSKEYLNPSQPSATFLQARKKLEPVSSETMMKRRATARVIHAKAWPEAKAWWDLLVKDAATGDPAAVQRMKDGYCGAMSMTLSDEPYDRASAYAFGTHALENDSGLLPDVLREMGITVSISPYTTAQRDDERWQMTIFVGALGGERILPFLVHAARVDRDWRVRRSGLLAISECIRKSPTCRIDIKILDALYEQWTDARTQTALISVAGALKSERTLRWCDGRLNDNAYALSCKNALSQMKTEASFDMLLAWLKTREREPNAFSPDNFGFREDFSYLVGFADEPYAKERFYRTLNRVLGESRRSGYATGGIAKHLPSLADRHEALLIARSHHKFYLKKWGPAPTTQDRQFLLKTLRKAREQLGDPQLSASPAPSAP